MLFKSWWDKEDKKPALGKVALLATAHLDRFVVPILVGRNLLLGLI